MKFYQLSIVAAVVLLTGKKLQAQAVYQDVSKPLDMRVADLVSKLTLEEKVSLLGYRSKAVPRLNIPAYNWWYIKLC